MELFIVILLLVNLLALVALLWLGMRLRRRNDDEHRSTLAQTESLAVMRQDLAQQRAELQQMLALAQQQQSQELARERDARSMDHRDLRNFLDASLNQRLQRLLKESLDENAKRIADLTASNSEKQELIRKDLRDELERMRIGNEQKLEKMRETVDEKLQGTLEKRLGESFALVSERLEQVQKGLGEMQTLASDVGGLKRVLTNVKNRGGWGEVQLARQLEDMLTPEQYEENVQIKPGSNERVEFAVRLPGRGVEQDVLYLPIDSKFPQEDYERLLEAQDDGDKERIDQALKNIERVMAEQAKLISSKYIAPPHSTDFAIMYLPTEGLFAEAIRMPGLVHRLQRDHRIVITGPSTLMMLLNSLQMGFRTLAIEKRSSEVWQVLGLAKAEFHKYAAVWEKLGRHLQTAQNTVEEAGRRTRAVERKLRDIETIETPDTETPIESVLEDMLDTEAIEK